jgi:hypothetical protein
MVSVIHQWVTILRSVQMCTASVCWHQNIICRSQAPCRVCGCAAMSRPRGKCGDRRHAHMHACTGVKGKRRGGAAGRFSGKGFCWRGGGAWSGGVPEGRLEQRLAQRMLPASSWGHPLARIRGQKSEFGIRVWYYLFWGRLAGQRRFAKKYEFEFCV